MTEKLTNAINEILNKLDESLSVDDAHSGVMDVLEWDVDYQWGDEYGEHEKFSNAVYDFIESKK